MDSLYIVITVTDNGSLIDGDTVTIILNGEIIAENHILAGIPGNEFELVLNSGENILRITAVDEGDVSPNTALLEITGVVEGIESQEWRLQTGETGTLVIEAPSAK